MSFCCTEAFLTLAAIQFDRVVAFYTNLFEQPPQTLIQNTYAEFCLPGMRLGIFRPKAAPPLPTDAPALDDPATSPCVPKPALNQTQLQRFYQPEPIQGFSLCLETNNLEAAIARLTQLSPLPLGPVITASHGQEFYAYDPEGNRLIIHQAT
jgi:hypothetical protein